MAELSQGRSQEETESGSREDGVARHGAGMIASFLQLCVGHSSRTSPGSRVER